MVTSINGNNVTWRNNKDNQLYTDSYNDLERIMKRGGKVKKRYNRGGLAVGPSHAQGGIPGVVGPSRIPMEFEGGEYIHSVESVNRYGGAFMNKVNTMQFKKGDTYTFKNGGGVSRSGRKLMPRRRKMQGGGFPSGNRSCPSGQRMQNGQCVPAGGGYSRGGRVRGRKRFRNGGMTSGPSGTHAHPAGHTHGYRRSEDQTLAINTAQYDFEHKHAIADVWPQQPVTSPYVLDVPGSGSLQDWSISGGVHGPHFKPGLIPPRRYANGGHLKEGSLAGHNRLSAANRKSPVKNAIGGSGKF